MASLIPDPLTHPKSPGTPTSIRSLPTAGNEYSVRKEGSEELVVGPPTYDDCVQSVGNLDEVSICSMYS